MNYKGAQMKQGRMRTEEVNREVGLRVEYKLPGAFCWDPVINCRDGGCERPNLKRIIRDWRTDINQRTTLKKRKIDAAIAQSHGRTEGFDGRVDGRVDGQVEDRADGRMDDDTDGSASGGTNDKIDERIDDAMNDRIDCIDSSDVGGLSNRMSDRMGNRLSESSTDESCGRDVVNEMSVVCEEEEISQSPVADSCVGLAATTAQCTSNVSQFGLSRDQISPQKDQSRPNQDQCSQKRVRNSPQRNENTKRDQTRPKIFESSPKRDENITRDKNTPKRHQNTPKRDRKSPKRKENKHHIVQESQNNRKRDKNTPKQDQENTKRDQNSPKKHLNKPEMGQDGKTEQDSPKKHQNTSKTNQNAKRPLQNARFGLSSLPTAQTSLNQDLISPEEENLTNTPSPFKLVTAMDSLQMSSLSALAKCCDSNSASLLSLATDHSRSQTAQQSLETAQNDGRTAQNTAFSLSSLATAQNTPKTALIDTQPSQNTAFSLSALATAQNTPKTALIDTEPSQNTAFSLSALATTQHSSTFSLSPLVTANTANSATLPHTTTPSLASLATANTAHSTTLPNTSMPNLFSLSMANTANVPTLPNTPSLASLATANTQTNTPTHTQQADEALSLSTASQLQISVPKLRIPNATQQTAHAASQHCATLPLTLPNTTAGPSLSSLAQAHLNANTIDLSAALKTQGTCTLPLNVSSLSQTPLSIPPLSQTPPLSIPPLGQTPPLNIPPLGQTPPLTIPPLGQTPPLSIPPLGQTPLSIPPLNQTPPQTHASITIPLLRHTPPQTSTNTMPIAIPPLKYTPGLTNADMYSRTPPQMQAEAPTASEEMELDGELIMDCLIGDCTETIDLKSALVIQERKTKKEEVEFKPPPIIECPQTFNQYFTMLKPMPSPFGQVVADTHTLAVVHKRPTECKIYVPFSVFAFDTLSPDEEVQRAMNDPRNPSRYKLIMQERQSRLSRA